MKKLTFRKFDGKTYGYTTDFRKDSAIWSANRLKKTGWLTRVVKGSVKKKPIYHIWVRRVDDPTKTKDAQIKWLRKQGYTVME